MPQDCAWEGLLFRKGIIRTRERSSLNAVVHFNKKRKFRREFWTAETVPPASKTLDTDLNLVRTCLRTILG